jgi:hypothetical protein
LVANYGQSTIFAQSARLFAAARKEYRQHQNFVTGAENPAGFVNTLWSLGGKRLRA